MKWLVPARTYRNIIKYKEYTLLMVLCYGQGEIPAFAGMTCVGLECVLNRKIATATATATLIYCLLLLFASHGSQSK